MKASSVLSFAVVLIILSSGFQLADSATAVTYCKSNVKTVSECTEPLSEATEIKGVNEGNFVFATTGGLVNPTVTCTSSSFSTVIGKITTEPTSRTGTTGTFVTTGCTDSITGGACEGKVLGLPSTIHIVTTEQGAVHSNGNGASTHTVFSWTFNCPKLKEATGAGHCEYAAQVKLHITGGSPPKYSWPSVGVSRTATDFGCPPDARINATYKITQPVTFFVI